ncbi:MAG: DUF1987 domain-containing protein [Bacteroidales bacterium]|nr:DUF1987 domain-containing protein [Bacteroidales bacterium]
MDNLIIEGTKQTPSINFNAGSGILEISGRSIPENTFEFFNPVLLWLEAYSQVAGEKTVINVKLEYFNTSSSKYILEIFKRLRSLLNDGKDVNVKWYYEEDDEEMMETGEDYQDVSGLDFEIIPIEE